MHRWTSRKQPRLIAEINLVPYMDLIFLLLFVFMLVVPLLKSELSGSVIDSALHAAPADYLVLEIPAKDPLLLNGRKVERTELKAAVAELLATRPKAGVMLKLAGIEPVTQVVEISAILRDAGVERIAIQATPNK